MLTPARHHRTPEIRGRFLSSVNSGANIDRNRVTSSTPIGLVTAYRGHPGLSIAMISTLLLLLAPDRGIGVHIGIWEFSVRIIVLMSITLMCAYRQLAGAAAPRFPYRLLWLIFLLIAVIGAIVNSRPQALPLFLLYIFAPFYVGACFGSETPRLIGALRGIIWGTIILSLWALGEFLTRRNVFRPEGPSLTNAQGHPINTAASIFKVNAGFSHALALSLVLCLGLFLVLEWSVGHPLWMRITMPGIVLVGIFVTQERSPLIGIAAGVVSLMLVNVSARARLRVAALAAAAVGVVLLFPGSQGTKFRDFLANSITPGSSAGQDISYRAALVRTSWHAFTLRPLAGWGYGSTAVLSENPILSSIMVFHNKSVTDVAIWPLAILVQMGAIAFVVFIGLVCCSVYRLARGYILENAALARVCMAGLIASFVTSFGVTEPASSIIFFFAMGLFVAGSQRVEQLSPVRNLVA